MVPKYVQLLCSVYPVFLSLLEFASSISSTWERQGRDIAGDMGVGA